VFCSPQRIVFVCSCWERQKENTEDAAAERRTALYVWGSEGQEARAAVGVTKGVRGGEHQRKHIRIMDPPPLCLLSLSLSLSRLTGFLFIVPCNSTALLLFSGIIQIWTRAERFLEKEGKIPAGRQPKHPSSSSSPVRNVFKQPGFHTHNCGPQLV